MSPPATTPASSTTKHDRLRSCVESIAVKISRIFCFHSHRINSRMRCFHSVTCTRPRCAQQARRLALPVAERPESQDICFGDYKALVASYAKESEVRAGQVVDRGGKVVGRHNGIHSVTVGQRRGLGISAAEPLYVVEIDVESKNVVVGKKNELSAIGLVAHSVNWLEPLDQTEIEAEVQIRYRAPAIACTIRPNANGHCEVRFKEAFPAVTPGQAAVFYRGEQLLGGGWIERAH